MVSSDDKVWAAQDVVSCLVQCIGYCQGFTFHWGISAFCRCGESAANQAKLPALLATCWGGSSTVAVLLFEYEAYALV